MEPGTGRLLDALHQAFPRMTIALSDQGRRQSGLNTHCTSFTESDTIALPKITSLTNGLVKWRSCQECVRSIEERSDILLVQLPFDSPLALLGIRRPTLYHACADLRSVARNSRFRGPLKFAGLLAARGIDSLYHKLVNARSARLIANGEELYHKYGNPKGKWVISSVISEQEIHSVTRKRPANAPFRILFAGYLRRWKGIDVLLCAFERLLKEIPTAELHIAGQSDFNEQATAESLAAQIQALGPSVRVLGHLPFGPELFQCFADADVLALPSRGVEGTPRVLIEARAFGCPVVATDVGGVRSTVEDGVDGLIVPPNDADALGAALLQIAREPDLRLRLMANGMRRAHQCTAESFAAEFIQELTALATSLNTEKRI
jgi:glycosyltransferase involved in cell wall biosynthesis